MDIAFDSRKFEKECNNHKLLVRKHGIRRAERIGQRLDDLRAATVLEDMRPPMPGRCHELVGDREGQLSLSLDYPYCLIFEPANNPIPRKDDDGLDWSKVTAILVIGVENYHG